MELNQKGDRYRCNLEVEIATKCMQCMIELAGADPREDLWILGISPVYGDCKIHKEGKNNAHVHAKTSRLVPNSYSESPPPPFRNPVSAPGSTSNHFQRYHFE